MDDRNRWLRSIAICALGFAVLAACRHRESSGVQGRGEPDGFEARLEEIVAGISGDRMMQNLERYVDSGHRYYGAVEREGAIARMIGDLEPYSASVQRQDFSAVEPLSGIAYRLTNIIARTAPGSARRLLLGTHWDTRLWADEDPDPARRDQPIPGANDGTSGLVVLLELLRVLDGADVADLGLDVVLFDGEEFGRAGSADYCRGSFHFARHLRQFYPRRAPVAAVIVDMVGDRELKLEREVLSMNHAPELCDLIWALGQARFPEVFGDGTVGPVFDDHVALQRHGVPAALLIDLEYRPWHTVDDTPEQCSAESLELVTRHLVELTLALAQQGDRQPLGERRP